MERLEVLKNLYSEESVGLALSSLSTNQVWAYNNAVLSIPSKSKKMDRFSMLNVLSSADGCHLTPLLKLKGPFMTNANACASGTSAFIDSFRSIVFGDARAMLVAGTEECVSPFNLNPPFKFGAMNKGEEGYTCAPFDKRRSTITLGEGAGAVIVRELEHGNAMLDMFSVIII